MHQPPIMRKLWASFLTVADEVVRICSAHVCEHWVCRGSEQRWNRIRRKDILSLGRRDALGNRPMTLMGGLCEGRRQLEPIRTRCIGLMRRVANQ